MKRATVNLPDGDYQKLVALAADLDRSMSWVIARAVRDVLHRAEHDVQYRLDFRADVTSVDSPKQ